MPDLPSIAPPAPGPIAAAIGVADMALLRATIMRSERRRILAIIAILVALAPLLAYRLMSTLGEGRLGGIIGLVLISGFAAYELTMLGHVNRKLREDSDISPSTWQANAIVEGLMPVIAQTLVVFTSGQNPFASLLAHTVASAYILIIASTLRLSPRLSLVGGSASVVGFAMLIGLVFLIYPYDTLGKHVYHWSAYPSACFVMLLATCAAGFVADEGRKHMVAAVREEQVKREKERLVRDLRVAQNIQQGLLPKDTPNLPGYDFAALCEPADETGGDYYDWQPTTPGRVLVSIADVTGHGVGPALVTASCRAYVRSMANAGMPPAELLTRLNTLLHEDIAPSRFVTLALLVVDTNAHRASLLSAGHGPTIRLRADGNATILPAQAPPLAILPTIELEAAVETAIEPGDVAMLLSDGLVEWRVGGQEFGVDRVVEVLRQRRSGNCKEIVMALRAALRDFAGGAPQLDDVTMVVIKRG